MSNAIVPVTFFNLEANSFGYSYGRIPMDFFPPAPGSSMLHPPAGTTWMIVWSYFDAAGTAHYGYRFYPSGSGVGDASPIVIAPFPGALFPSTATPPGDPATNPAFDGTITYPDDWHEARIVVTAGNYVATVYPLGLLPYAGVGTPPYGTVAEDAAPAGPFPLPHSPILAANIPARWGDSSPTYIHFSPKMDDWYREGDNPYTPSTLSLAANPLPVGFGTDPSFEYQGMGLSNGHRAQQPLVITIEIEYGDDATETFSHNVTLPGAYSFQYYESGAYLNPAARRARADAGVLGVDVTPTFYQHWYQWLTGTDYPPLPEAPDWAGGWVVTRRAYQGALTTGTTLRVGAIGNLISMNARVRPFHHEYPEEGTARAKMRYRDSWGRSSQWKDFGNLMPVALFTPEGEYNPQFEVIEGGDPETWWRGVYTIGQHAVFDASASFDVGGAVVKYHWYVTQFNADTGEYSGTHVTTEEPILEFDYISNRMYAPSAWYEVLLTVEDAQGKFSMPTSRFVRIGSEDEIDLLHSLRSGELWILFAHSGEDGPELRCARHLRLEAPRLDENAALVASGHTPGTIRKHGAKLLVVSRQCHLFESPLPGTSWSYVMTLAEDCLLLGRADAADGSTIYLMVLDDEDTPKRVLARRTKNGYAASEPEAVSGLPEDVGRPGAMTLTGTTFRLLFHSEGNVLLATSQDEMRTWTVV